MWYDVCKIKKGGYKAKYNLNSRGLALSTTTIEESYRVIVRGQSDPLAVNEVEVGCYSGVPKVGFDSYWDPDAGVILPWAICDSVSIKRDSKSPFVFWVDVSFASAETTAGQCSLSPPATLDDLSPLIVPSIGYYERPMYEDRDGNQCWKLPTGSPYQTPVMQKIPILTLTVTQFEAAISFEQMLERSFRTNDSVWRTKPAGRWIIGQVQAANHRVRLSGGYQEAAKVTYPITMSEEWYTDLDGVKVIYAHDHVQPLVDTIYIDASGDLKPFKDAKTEVNKAGYINSDGTERDPDDAGGATPDRPDYLRHRTQEPIDFNSFLKV